MADYYFARLDAPKDLSWLNAGETYESKLQTHNLVKVDGDTIQVVHSPTQGWLVDPVPTDDEIRGVQTVQAPKGTTDEEFVALLNAAMSSAEAEQQMLEHLREKYAHQQPKEGTK